MVTSPQISTSVLLAKRFTKVEGLCAKVGRRLMVTIEDNSEMFQLARTPALINVVHGRYAEYQGNMQQMEVRTG